MKSHAGFSVGWLQVARESVYILGGSNQLLHIPAASPALSPASSPCPGPPRGGKFERHQPNTFKRAYVMTSRDVGGVGR
jgi:hypothetical protein